ncbi:MAG: Fe-S-containing hydro-lyase [Firmicutes bacterium]|nr:Fe-S-containing hydro-lyase [Bacillota bacterium]MBQ6260557.1 Fe-S-containing hydro-lyase [Bacillota bacterium]MBR0114332.1 Fe-S-containing hydro-lyase [Bacillota bacterium]MBR0522207.1 Fe-S-containing hydro-lyase [Bacillota bacterium]
MAIKINTPLTRETARTLKCGDSVEITGVIYTARDAAHKRLCQLLDEGKPLPVDLTDGIIYFAGPAPAKPGQPIGSVGPTTSYRMDPYSPRLIREGLTGMIGKGKRSPEVVEAMKECGAVYFGAIGGCAALLAKCVKKAEVVCYEDLGAEAVRRLEVENFPVTVIIDSEGNNLYESGRAGYLKTLEEGTKMEQKTIVIGVIGADVHAVGNKILYRAFTDAGFNVINLGVTVSQEEFINAAIESNADAILISSLYGQGELDCRGMREKCVEAGIPDILLYVGGNIVIGKQDFEQVEKRFKDMGYNRAFPPGTDPSVDIECLHKDLHMDE